MGAKVEADMPAIVLIMVAITTYREVGYFITSSIVLFAPAMTSFALSFFFFGAYYDYVSFLSYLPLFGSFTNAMNDNPMRMPITPINL